VLITLLLIMLVLYCVTDIRRLQIRHDARLTRDRWPKWTPRKTRIRRKGLFLACNWNGPIGGRYTALACTHKGLDYKIEKELARWTRKRRKVGTL
jgi:hypothetical protein